MTQTTTPVRPKRAAKPNGQWKIDGPAPLNATEEMKASDNGLNVRARIEEIYAVNGFDSIDPEDLHGRFRWWGLYTQRAQGIPGGKTATLSPEELEDRYFMLRVRIDGGALSTEQLRVIGQISTEFARDTADLTDRQNVQLHWVDIVDVPEIWRRLESVGLHTTEACGDVPRVILGSPVAGIAKDEIIDPTPVIAEISRRYIGNPEFSNLPRKYKTAISGHPNQDVVHEINDFALIGIVHPELGPGYDLWVGGGLSSNPRLGERLGVFVTQDEAADVWEGVTSIFRDYGYRRLRNRARLKFLLADWGTEKFRRILEEEYLGRALPSIDPGPQPTEPGDHSGVHEQKDGKFFVGLTPDVGRVSGTKLTALADLLESHGSYRLRTTPHQKILALDLDESQIQDFVGNARALGLEAFPGLLKRSAIACTGIEFCKLAIVDTKNTTIDAVKEIESRLADHEGKLPKALSLHVNGCPNSCARVQTADLGFKGQLITNDAGEQVSGFQVHLGGTLAGFENGEASLGRTVRGLKVEADKLPDYVERVVKNYSAHADEGESFAAWAHRVEEDLLK
ncbi:sulfite reductase [Glutamicibacter uratoxydans]|uniref:assimilatory sulfite reductase (ferredoxin) n=1 Tax=Glutamicibacter uratoxydans TaxID=43667 RepID=A0A4Y4DP59_GLUUR|nr:nitrite/sulfite reductase [Glutamicibacter uratoxydans]GED06387.1 sulfite reductase [Glutamicibacter uratoxydans]